MIIMKYNGGLGNQIFQYLAGKTLAEKLNCELFFDMSFFKGRKTRKYEMNIFGIEENPCKDIRPLLYWKLRKILKMPKKFLGLNIYNEESFSYEEKFEKIENNTFVEGFFQSPKYFNENVVNKINFEAKISEKTREIEEKIKEENSISMHIRLGDYVQKSHYSKIYNHLDENYYKKAIEIIKEKVKNPVFYVFSDDIRGASKILSNIQNVIYINHNIENDSWQDMYLMSKCKHNIIANSSFSYFGAYLNKNPEKTVIAPKKWFQDPNKTTDDVYPDNWIKI
ncbi:MAG: alpha-1,2-fucosyltransferase [Cyanobacteria bacterium SIG30]|nr:alpha-1,2-fucosyltransferase [Cyanobacteria bacterium SIG30]